MLPDLPTNFPAYSGTYPAVGGNARADPARRGLRDVLRRQVASRPARPAGHRPVRHVADRRSASTATTGSSTARRTSGRRTSCATRTTSSRRATPADGYHLDADLADNAIAYLRELRISHPDRPFLLWYASAAPHAPHQAPPEWIDRFRGQFDDGWDAWREATLARQIELGIVPAGTRAVGAPAVDRGMVRRSTRRPPSSLRADDGGVRGVHRARRPSASVACSTISRRPASSTTRSSCSCPTTARRAKAARTARTTSSATTSPTNPTTSPTSSRTSTTSAASARAATTRGAGRWPATRRSGAGSGTRSKAVCATRSSSPARASPTRGGIRDQYCHATDVLPTVLELCGVALPDDARRHRADELRRREPRPGGGRRGRARGAHDASTTSAGAAGRCTTTAGRP